MNKFSIIGLVVFVILLIFGCVEQKKSDYMNFDNIVYVDKFQKYFSIKNGKVLNLDLVGIDGLTVKDSILIVSTQNDNGFWSFFRLPNCNFLGKYITKGKGANELLASPRVSWQYFTKRDDHIISIIYDFNTGKIFEMNISETLNKKQLVMYSLDNKLPKNLFNFIILDSTSFFCREINSDYTKLLRFILKNKEKYISKNMEILNYASIDRGFDFNILGTYTIYNQNENKIVEAAMDMNIINLYSIDDTSQMTICVGNGIDNISNIQRIERKDKKVMYKHLISHNKYFSALYLNDTNINIQTEKQKNLVIQFFNWDGKPLIEVTLDRFINSYDIDFVNNCLYTLNYETDEICQYDIKEILEYLETVN